MNRPRGLLFDYGGTLVEEVGFNTRAATEWLLTHSVKPPSDAAKEEIYKRAERVTREVANRRDEFHIETPWPAITRLIHDACGTRFTRPVEDLELGFWDAGVETRPMPGAREALDQFREMRIPMGVVSNASFSRHTIRHELAKHGLSEHLKAIVVSSEYVVRKPSPLAMEVAARLIDVPCADIWFVGDRLDTDVAGAIAAGMTPVWLMPRNASIQSTAGVTIGAWSELAELLREMTHGSA